MKTFKKVVAIFILFIALSSIAGYIYFDKKFTPDDNYLTLRNESGRIPMHWSDTNKSALLIPIHFLKDTTTYYLQFDTGSPYTLFYKNSIKNISAIQTKIDKAITKFQIGKCEISSNKLKIIDFGKSYKSDEKFKIIGTMGTDVFENKKTVLNFKEAYIVLNLEQLPPNFNNNCIDFEFKKRKIIIKGQIEGNNENFLFDSGSSSYELLTSKEIWQKLKIKKAKVKTEKANSWSNVLTSYSAPSDKNISFGNSQLPLNEVTYVEGISKMQYFLMKFSGMTGMLGNKIFLNHCIYFDVSQQKMWIK